MIGIEKLEYFILIRNRKYFYHMIYYNIWKRTTPTNHFVKYYTICQLFLCDKTGLRYNFFVTPLIFLRVKVNNNSTFKCKVDSSSCPTSLCTTWTNLLRQFDISSKCAQCITRVNLVYLHVYSTFNYYEEGLQTPRHRRRRRIINFSHTLWLLICVENWQTFLRTSARRHSVPYTHRIRRVSLSHDWNILFSFK